MRWRSNWFVWLCLLGIFGCVLFTLWPNYYQALRSHRWEPVRCTVVRSEVGTEPFSQTVTHFVLQVEFAYQFAGKEYRSTRFTTGSHQGSTDVTKAEEAAVRYPPGKRAECYVNPQDPSEAVLQRGDLWIGLILLLPILLAGLVMHQPIFAWFERRRQWKQITGNVPWSDRNDAFRTDRFLVWMAIGSLLMGVFFLGFNVTHPLRRWWQSKEWKETEATITRCELSSRTGLHGPEYSLELTYEYEFGGRHYRSGRRGFGMSIDTPVIDLSQWVATHRPNQRVRCFVDPNEPTEAVLERNLEIEWVTPSLGVLMFGFGIYLGLAMWQARSLRRRLVGTALQEYCLGKPQRKPLELRVSPPSLLVAIGCVIGSLPLGLAGWWSISKGVRAMMNWQGDLINSLYGLGAAIGAICLICQAWKYLVRWWRPRPTLKVTPGTPKVKEAFQVEWKFSGAKQSVNRTRIWLEATEEVKIKMVVRTVHGPMSEEKIQRLVFATLPVVEATGKAATAGKAEVSIPAGQMHSFRGFKCGLVWRIKVEYGGAGGWKGDYEFPVCVMPES